jgi:tripartite-type tricarboxylate transporter receptor subunit TctC
MALVNTKQRGSMKRIEHVRNTLTIAAALAAAVPVSAQTGAAQSWPTRPVRIVAPFAPGGGTDIMGRVLTQKLSENVGGTYVLENRPGAGATVGAAYVAKSAPDGYTLLITAPEMSIHPSLTPRLPYDPLKDFTVISQLTSGKFILASHPSVPVRTVRDLIALAKKSPGRLNYGTSGPGGINHLSGLLFQSLAGMRWTHVPYKGSGASVIALMTGDVEFIFGSSGALVGPAKGGKIRAVAITTQQRFAELPDVPTIAESGVPAFNVENWYGFYGPAGLSPEIVRRLQAGAKRGLHSPEAKQTLNAAGNEPVVSMPEEFAAFLRSEIAKWSKVVSENGLRNVE